MGVAELEQEQTVFLSREREVIERLCPGLDEALCARAMLDMERPGHDALQLFKDHRGPSLLIPSKYGGLGANPVDAVRFQRAIGSRSPSLAVGTTMHHFSVATLVEACDTGEGEDWRLLETIAAGELLVSSGFAEGRPGQGLFATTMRARETADGYYITGSKKPCSLSHSMDLLTASVRVERDGGADELGVALISADAEGIERRPFWASTALAGAESDEVVLEDVLVASDFVVPLEEGSTTGTDAVGLGDGFVWFEAMITASYLGVGSGLVERVLSTDKGAETDRVTLAFELEGPMAALECVAGSIHRGSASDDLLARILLVRYSAQEALRRAGGLAAELLGGMAFVKSPDVAYLVSALHALGFHPPSRPKAAGALNDYLAGRGLTIE
ncbi:MAG: acyl-CoA/acyl-ACP dehydrogenase [Actinomycetota bacterium]|nr:acyl-CoA/acyl-ACP dehydrogenase [Actinomycetota bacterium]